VLVYCQRYCMNGDSGRSGCAMTLPLLGNPDR
jgi:hypothetical protein